MEVLIITTKIICMKVLILLKAGPRNSFLPAPKKCFRSSVHQKLNCLKCNVSVPLYNLVIIKINTPRALTITTE